MRLKPTQQSAFTLIELLVVISIIAILAGIGLPVYSTVLVRGEQTKALTHAKQIGFACISYAKDNNGSFPNYTDYGTKTPATSSSTSNQILQTLIPDYVPDKSLFIINKSKYCKNAGTAAANTPENFPKLGAAENEWAYVCGLTDTSYARWPFLADGFYQNTSYSPIASEYGGVWQAKKAIVIRCDGSGAVETLKKSDKTVKRISDEADATAKDAFVDGAGDTPPWFAFSDTLFVAQAQKAQ